MKPRALVRDSWRKVQPVLRTVGRWIAAPGWAGWGTIVAIVSMFATIGVAVILWRFSDQEQRARDAANEANVAVSSVFVVRDTSTGEWWVSISLVNTGPATAQASRIDWTSGGVGVASIGELSSTKGVVTPAAGRLIEKGAPPLT